MFPGAGISACQWRTEIDPKQFSRTGDRVKAHKTEVDFLDTKLKSSLRGCGKLDGFPVKKNNFGPRNHLLNNWLNPYVKDVINLNGFKADPSTIFNMLQGLAPAAQIKKSVEFLIREGFWRKTESGRIVPDEAVVTTSNGLPNQKIRAFHKKALALASRGISLFPVDQRKAMTVLISVDNEQLIELNSLLDSFQSQLSNFIQENPNGNRALVQVAIHLTPVGRAR